MFIDASVLAAMMTDENDAREFATRMQADTVRMTSPSTVAQAAIHVAAMLDLSFIDAGDAIRTFLTLVNIQLLATPPRAAFLALEAYECFGKGRHPADLDLDDCMAYACARYYRQPLLAKGDRFGHTDIDMA
ncbi:MULTISPECIES: type II toxin-antitoxin system VapC family toxin [Rhizobium]|uniref:Ribonuclease VapC n=1 Tax=Rhizobium paranaense TaxID=1650438 RepID=A0A7W8XQP8_9HYPH|nr:MULTISPECIES: type II toxin-antitoxin system VapC family toxin [Rhizobium]MBB5573863.1 ribonuclease VapC [Rhizobium paranaense]PST61416.1 VapC toxin family PIN domain ribonuclease [Rhizobium sp. SEMIA4064]